MFTATSDYALKCCPCHAKTMITCGIKKSLTVVKKIAAITATSDWDRIPPQAKYEPQIPMNHHVLNKSSSDPLKSPLHHCQTAKLSPSNPKKALFKSRWITISQKIAIQIPMNHHFHEINHHSNPNESPFES